MRDRQSQMRVLDRRLRSPTDPCGWGWCVGSGPDFRTPAQSWNDRAGAFAAQMHQAWHGRRNESIGTLAQATLVGAFQSPHSPARLSRMIQTRPAETLVMRCCEYGSGRRPSQQASSRRARGATHADDCSSGADESQCDWPQACIVAQLRRCRRHAGHQFEPVRRGAHQTWRLGFEKKGMWCELVLVNYNTLPS